MEFRRKSKALSGLPISLYGLVILFLMVIFSFNSNFYKHNPSTENILTEVIHQENSKTTEEPSKPEIYVPENTFLEEQNQPETTEDLAENKIPEQEKKEIEKVEKATEEKAKEKMPKSENAKIASYIPGTFGNGKELPPHNCKTKGELVMFYKMDKNGNVISARRKSGINEECNITAGVIWLKKYVKGSKSDAISEGTYTIKF